MTILTAVLFLKRRLLKIAKSPVLRTCGNDNSKSRYGNEFAAPGAIYNKDNKHWV